MTLLPSLDHDGGSPLFENDRGASRDHVASLQLTRLRRTLLHAYANVPHYRQAFDSRGVHPDDLRCITGLADFPFLVKDDLRRNYPFGMLAVPRKNLRRIHASSGTTGQPTIVGYTAGDLRIWAELVARSIRAAGGRRGDLIHIAYGYGLFTGGLGAHYGAERAGCTVLPCSAGQIEKQVRMIRDLEPALIMVTPSYMLALIDEAARQGFDLAKSSLRTGMFGAEPWSEAMRAQIEAGAGLEAIDIYGLSEVMGPGVACENMGDKGALTIWEDHFYPEIVDPVSGTPLPDGQLGELVLTSLTKDALPVVRYRTRDLTRLLPATRSFRRIDRIHGRCDDLMIIRGVNVYPTQIEEILLRSPIATEHYQIVLRRDGRLDQAILRCELRDAGLSASSDQVGALRQRIKAVAGVNIEVEPVPIQTLPRSSGGKVQRVLDLRQI